MMKPALLGAAAMLAAAVATPAMAQEATQEPGMIGYTYPNSHYLTGGYGVRTPYNTGRYPRLRGDYTYVGPGYYVAPGYVVGPAYGGYLVDPY